MATSNLPALVMKAPEEFESCAQRLKALAEPERLRIIACLFAGPKNVGDLANELGHSIVKVSHHLGVLREANLVKAQKRGRFVEYTLHPEVTGRADVSNLPTFVNLGCCRLDLGSAAAKKASGKKTLPRRARPKTR
jgi:DNA-binding transcriptional ArsR family regulator